MKGPVCLVCHHAFDLDNELEKVCISEDDDILCEECYQEYVDTGFTMLKEVCSKCIEDFKDKRVKASGEVRYIQPLYP